MQERVLTKCDQCRDFWLERSQRGVPGDPPCEICRVDLMRDNEDAIKVFSVVQDQYIMAEGVPVAINQLAIHAVIDLYHIKNRIECFHKVLSLAQWHLKETRKKQNNG